MSSFSRFIFSYKALRQLGSTQLGLYALYQLGLRSGHFQRTLDEALTQLKKLNRNIKPNLHPCLPSLPDRQTMHEMLGTRLEALSTEAEEIVTGKVRLFGSQPLSLNLIPPGELSDWTKYENGEVSINGQDIKLTWEAARFGWACKLALAYHLSANERYAVSFWHNAEEFLASNPPYMGPNWSSAQEAAIRLVVLAYAAQVFAGSIHSTPERMALVSKTIAIHAERIPPTIAYARSQNNNHLVTEALGLYTASAVLPDHPLSAKWHKLGWKWLMHAFRTQIAIDGTYAQHSTNYHRLMLQCALWAVAVQKHAFTNQPFPSDVLSKLEAATRWLWKLVDPATGRVPNLGHNDGSYILPLTVCPFEDYRPVLHAAAQAFLHTDLVPKGPWNDMATWLCLRKDKGMNEIGLDFWHKNSQNHTPDAQPPFTLVNRKNDSWAILRVATFTSRPAHADQLHLDLWWRGLNFAQDPGTYLYNAPAPWDNSLTSAFVHNTLTVDHREFMQRASRFLYLDWAQGRILKQHASEAGEWASMTASHDGYRKLGLTHTREVTAHADGNWEVIDRLEGSSPQSHFARLLWLLPDWEYEIDEQTAEDKPPTYEIRVRCSQGWIKLRMGINPVREIKPPPAMRFQLARSGKLLAGAGSISPITGWTSPTYGDKMPALACIIELTQYLPIELKSEWILPSES